MNVITLYMWKQHNFETVFISYVVRNIQYAIEKSFGSRKISYSMGVNTCFGPRTTNRPHATPNYVHGEEKIGIKYYRPTYSPPGKLDNIQ